MKRVTEKLKSRAGASLLFAILVFLLCVLAGTAALTAAAANSGRYTHLEAEQQAYLAVSSAAKLFRDEFVNSKYTATVETKKESNPTTGDKTAGAVKDGKIDAADPAKSPFPDLTIPTYYKDYLDSAVGVKEGVPGSSVTSAPGEFTVTFEEIEVKVTCEASGYNLTFTFTQGDSYKTELTLVGTANSSAPDVKTEEDAATNTTTTTTTKTVTVTWQEENAIISQGRN